MGLDQMEPHGYLYIYLHLMGFGGIARKQDSFPYILSSLDPLNLCFKILEHNFMV